MTAFVEHLGSPKEIGGIGFAFNVDFQGNKYHAIYGNGWLYLEDEHGSYIDDPSTRLAMVDLLEEWLETNENLAWWRWQKIVSLCWSKSPILSKCPDCDAAIVEYEVNEHGVLMAVRAKRTLIENDIIKVDYSKFPQHRLGAYRETVYCWACGRESDNLIITVTSRAVHSVTTTLTSRSILIVPDDEFWMYEPKFNQIKVYQDTNSIPWLMLRYYDAHFSNELDTSPMFVDRHIIGPFTGLCKREINEFTNQVIYYAFHNLENRKKIMFG